MNETPVSPFQELYDKIAVHLLSQNAKSKSNEGNCVYRGLNGLKCAAGILIPDEEYHPSIEGLNFLIISGMSRRYTREQLTFITQMQVLHDCIPVHSWRKEILNLGHQFNLSTSLILSQFP